MTNFCNFLQIDVPLLETNWNILHNILQQINSEEKYKNSEISKVFHFRSKIINGALFSIKKFPYWNFRNWSYSIKIINGEPNFWSKLSISDGQNWNFVLKILLVKIRTENYSSSNFCEDFISIMADLDLPMFYRVLLVFEKSHICFAVICSFCICLELGHIRVQHFTTSFSAL